MKILYAASEALPFIASGGLADVAGSLPRALRNHKQACRVVMPLYSEIKPEWREKLKFVTSFYVDLSWRHQYCGIFEATVDGVKYYFLDNEYYFKRKALYGYFDDAERFAFFSLAVVAMVDYIDFEPDIIHCNDWQTSLVPVYLNCFFRHQPKHKNIKTVFTIHNIQYQGQYSPEILSDVLGLSSYHAGILDYEKCINFMKGAIVEANAISTVSPTYAKEILDPWYSHRLDPILRQRSGDLTGILNGIDIVSYNPETDPNIFESYSAKDFSPKKKNKKALQQLLGLNESDSMLIGVVTRLVGHKGIDLIKYIFHEIVASGTQIAILGSGDYAFEQFFFEMRKRYAGQVSFSLGFIPDLARKIYAGADVFLMPSQSEPCGLAQMVAARYGTLPIVRETGGLADSITDLWSGDKTGNGYTFKSYNAGDMMSAIERARGDYCNPEVWKKYMAQAMNSDFSWNKSAKEYIKMYESVLEK